jgi:hypothetical protein
MNITLLYLVMNCGLVTDFCFFSVEGEMFTLNTSPLRYRYSRNFATSHRDGTFASILCRQNKIAISSDPYLLFAEKIL